MPTERGGAGGARGWASSSQKDAEAERAGIKGGVGSGRGLRTGKMIQDVCTNPDIPRPPPTPLSPPQGPR